MAVSSSQQKDQSMTNISRVLGFTLAASIAFAGQAFAHAHLKASTPADKATVTTSPSELDLTFTEELNLKFTGIKLIGPKKQEIKTGAGMLTDGDKGLMIPVSDKLDAGTYTVEWHALSADGHKTNGTYSFTVKP